MMKAVLQRTMSLTDVNTSSAIRDRIERDLTIPADKRKYRFFLQLPRHDFILPSLTRFDPDFRKFLLSVLVDYGLMQELENAKCVNWCSILPKFLALKTMGDGNCLMHAASLCMWAVQDRRTTLRKTVYQVLIKDQTEMFRKRWQFEQERHLEEQNGSPVDCSDEQWNEDWAKTIELASTAKSSETNSLNALEEIHIFALANILRRPILVLCEDVHRGNYDESLAHVNLGGIYLPLLCDSVDCIKSPIVIGYHQGHFMALVTTEDGCASGEDIIQRQGNKNAVPLVKHDDSPIQVHFLLPDEQQSSDRLLREYLNCSRIEYNSDDVTRTILVATMQSQEPEAHLDQMFKTYFGVLQDVYLEILAERQLSLSGEYYRQPSPASMGRPLPYNMQYYGNQGVHQNTARCCSAHKRCKNAVCKNLTTQDYCHQCRKTKAQLCTSPGCTFIANPEYENLCSQCFARYRAILEQGQAVVTPSAPPSNKCSTSDCQFDACPHFHGKCHLCYLSCIQGPNIGNITATTASSTATGEQCATGEQHVSADLHDENRVAMVPPSLPRQNSRLFCATKTCNNPLKHTGQYCETCSAFLPTNDVHMVGSVGQPGAEITNFKSCCISGCNMHAVTYHGQLCYKHYHESLSHHKSKNDRMLLTKERTKCVNSGCTFYGDPESNYLCSKCYAQSLQNEYDMQRIHMEQDRAQEEWTARQYAERSREQFQFDYQRKPFYHEAISEANRSASAPPSPNRKQRIDTIPCVTKGCPHFGTKEKQGLCVVCSEKKEVLLYDRVHGRERHSSMP